LTQELLVGVKWKWKRRRFFGFSQARSALVGTVVVQNEVNF
jgi:hypothetical protein